MVIVAQDLQWDSYIDPAGETEEVIELQDPEGSYIDQAGGIEVIVVGAEAPLGPSYIDLAGEIEEVMVLQTAVGPELLLALLVSEDSVDASSGLHPLLFQSLNPLSIHPFQCPRRHRR